MKLRTYLRYDLYSLIFPVRNPSFAARNQSTVLQQIRFGINDKKFSHSLFQRTGLEEIHLRLEYNESCYTVVSNPEYTFQGRNRVSLFSRLILLTFAHVVFLTFVVVYGNFKVPTLNILSYKHLTAS